MARDQQGGSDAEDTKGPDGPVEAPGEAGSARRSPEVTADAPADAVGAAPGQGSGPADAQVPAGGGGVADAPEAAGSGQVADAPGVAASQAAGGGGAADAPVADAPVADPREAVRPAAAPPIPRVAPEAARSEAAAPEGVRSDAAAAPRDEAEAPSPAAQADQAPASAPANPPADAPAPAFHQAPPPPAPPTEAPATGFAQSAEASASVNPPAEASAPSFSKAPPPPAQPAEAQSTGFVQPPPPPLPPTEAPTTEFTQAAPPPVQPPQAPASGFYQAPPPAQPGVPHQSIGPVEEVTGAPAPGAEGLGTFGAPGSGGPPAGFGWPPAMPPMPPAAPVGPADPLRALAAALLNLSGLGLGYALMRQWAAMVVCWVATAVLLTQALPADPDGVSHGLVVGYVAVLVLAAAHGAVRALRTPFAWPPKAPLAAVLGLVLLAVPVGGAVYYDGARDEATQKMLLDTLDQADHLVQAAKAKPFTSAKADYRTALSTYRGLHRDHAGSRAAKRVPDRLQAYYTTVAAPFAAGDYCGAIAPLTYLRTVPDTYGAKDLGALATWPDSRLARSLYECGAADLADNGSGSGTGGDNFADLLTTFPHAPEAAKVESAIAASIAKAGKGVAGTDPCAAADRAEALSSRATALPGSAAGLTAALAKDAKRADGYVQSGTYACGVHQYHSGDFDDALETMNGFVKSYPHDGHHALAQKYAIAAEVATGDSTAGKKAPTMASTGGGISVTVKNDSPDGVTVLYTGTVTGTFTLPGCDGCKTYSSVISAHGQACHGGKNYPQKTLSLPPGTIYFMHKNSDTSTTPANDSEKLEYGYIYTECAYSVSDLGVGL